MWFILLFMVMAVFSDPIGEFVYDNKNAEKLSHDVYKADFEITHTHQGVNFIITVPLYIVRNTEDKKLTWALFFLPKEFYKKVSGWKRKKYTSNDQIEAHEFEKTFDTSTDTTIQGGKISIEEDRSKNWFANVDDLRFSDADIQHTIKADGIHPIKKWKSKYNIAKGNIKVTHLFSKALDSWLKTLGIGKVTVQDNAYFPCGTEKPFTPAVAQLFIRIWFGKAAKDGASLYMKPAFGSYTLKDRQQFDNLAKEVHDTKYGDVLSQLKQKGVNNEKEIKAMTKIITDANTNNIKTNKLGLGLNNRLKKRNNVAQWNTGQVHAQKMGDIMTVLWYMGDPAKCGDYVKVFKWLYGEEKLDKMDVIHYDEGCKYEIPFCDKLHTLRSNVQHLFKNLIEQQQKPMELSKLSKSDVQIALPSLIHNNMPIYEQYELVWYAFSGHSSYHRPMPKVAIPSNSGINFFSQLAVAAACFSDDADAREKWRRISKIPQKMKLQELLPAKTRDEFWEPPYTLIDDFVMVTADDGYRVRDSGIYQYIVLINHDPQDGNDNKNDFVDSVLRKVKVELPENKPNEPGIALSQFFKSQWFKERAGRVFYLGCRTESKTPLTLVKGDPFKNRRQVTVTKERNSISEYIAKWDNDFSDSHELFEQSITRKDTATAVVYKDNEYHYYDPRDEHIQQASITQIGQYELALQLTLSLVLICEMFCLIVLCGAGCGLILCVMNQFTDWRQTETENKYQNINQSLNQIAIESN